MTTHRVLFVGNSYTHCNHLPRMLAKLAESRADGDRFDAAMVTQGGVTLRWHWENPETLDAIRAGDHDVVVLQDHSLGPVEHRERMLAWGQKLGDEIAAAGARIVLYLTWARRRRPEMQSALTEGYVQLAGRIGARIAPCGLAWKTVLAERPDIVLHTEDDSHPTPAGSYLNACVFYAVITGASPEGLAAEVELDGKPVVSLDAKDAAYLQETAWKTVQDFDPTRLN